MSCLFFRPSAPPQPLRRLRVISFFSPPGAATTASKAKCHYFFLRPSCAATAAAQFACHLLFSAHLRRHSRCEVCVSSLFSNSRHRHSRCECLGSFLFFRLPAPPRPLRSLSVMSAVCPPGAASTGAKCECRLFFSALPAPPAAAAKFECHLFFFAPWRRNRRCEACVTSLFVAPLRRHNRCEVCVSYFSDTRRRHSRFSGLCHVFPLPCATQYQAGVVFVSCSFFLSC